jgi:hypothetical protein
MPSIRQIQHPSEVIHCPFSCQKGVALWGWVSKTMCMHALQHFLYWQKRSEINFLKKSEFEVFSPQK